MPIGSMWQEPEQTVGPAAETPDVILETETQASETPPTALDDKSTSGAAEKSKDKDKDDKDRSRDPEKDKLKEKEKEGEKKMDKDTEKVKGAEGASLDSLLQRLPGCVSRDLIDQLTVMLPNRNFACYFHFVLPGICPSSCAHFSLFR